MRKHVTRSCTLLLMLAFTTLGAPAARAAPSADEALRKQARARFLEGKKRFALRQFRAALRSFKKAYELVPLSGFLFNIGQCYRFLGDCKTAIFYYSGFVRENPGTPDAKFVNGLVTRCKGRLAVVRAQQAKAHQLFLKGKTALVLGQYAEAAKQFTAAYRTKPLPGYLFHLGKAHQGLKKYAKAVHFYRQYLQQNPGTPKTKSVKALINKCEKLHEDWLEKQRRAGRIKANLGLGSKRGPPPKPIYKRWWLWTTVATVVAAAVGLGLGFGLPRPQKLPAHDLVWDARTLAAPSGGGQ